MTTCRSCDAPVIFVPSAKTGKAMILDAEPTKGVIVFAPDEVKIAPGHIANQYERLAAVVDVYTDHHVTCEHADDWKGRTRADPPV